MAVNLGNYERRSNNDAFWFKVRVLYVLFDITVGKLKVMAVMEGAM